MTFVSGHAASMSSGLLLEPMMNASADGEPSSNAGQRFRPYASPHHHVTKGRYITSNDPRGYIPVYEYPLNGQWIMLDMDDGYVLWTGIWKALGNSKADIVKMIESQPDLASKLRRVRGGYLKIQGTWMPYEIALRLARRVAWPIRHELIPLFGPTFPDSCLSPDKPGYGQVVKSGTGRRRSRRTYPTTTALEGAHDWTVISPQTHAPADGAHATTIDPPFTFQPRRRLGVPASSSYTPSEHLGSPVQLHMPYSLPPYPASASSPPSPLADDARRPSSSGLRYSPYPSSLHHPSRLSTPAAAPPDRFARDIRLPPLQAPDASGRRRSVVALPPIAALVDRQPGYRDDSAAVLRRLQSRDDDDEFSAPPRRADGPWHTVSPRQAHARPLPGPLHAYSPSAWSSPRTSALASPVSPSVVTPTSAASSFEHGRSPKREEPGGQWACGDGPLNAAAAAAPGLHVGCGPDAPLRAWRPW